MTAFVPVHGSGQNAESWSRVSDLLRGRGHTVATPDLPKKAADWGLEDHAAEIAKGIETPDAVVVGHSFSGAFLPHVATVRECALLIFWAAVIPEPGKSVRDQFTEDASMFHPEWIAAGSRWFDESQRDDLAREFLFHDCNEATMPWALRGVEFMDTQPLITQQAPFTAWPDVATASVVATSDRTLSADWGRRISRRVLGVDSIEVEAGHCPHVSQPAEAAELLERLANRG